MLMPLREKQTAPQEDLQNAEAACAQAWTSNFTGNKEAKGWGHDSAIVCKAYLETGKSLLSH